VNRRIRGMLKLEAGPVARDGGSCGASPHFLDARAQERGDLAKLQSAAALGAEVAESAINIGWITHDIRAVAEDSTKIASAAEKLSATMAELSTSSVTVAHDADKVRAETDACRADMSSASESMRAMKARVAAVNERVYVLESAVKQIADMAKTIDAISKQTNLLALNATIEAARAGAAGRGFAVVAGEVKSLSAQTAQATEQIRSRIATLDAEMTAIKQEIVLSGESVADGEKTVQTADGRIAIIDDQMVAMTACVKSLAEVLGQQGVATGDISKRAKRIAAKATKSRGEIDGSLELLLKAESGALAMIETHHSGNPAEYELTRAKADLAVWKRELAATLVGLKKPDRKLIDRGRRLGRWSVDVGEAALRGHPAFMALRAADATSRAAAARFISAAETADWQAATEAYVATEKAIGETVGHADALLQFVRASKSVHQMGE
jgi:chromosome segregation ATPase